MTDARDRIRPLPRRARLAVAASVLLAVGLAACSSDDDDVDAGGGGSSTTAPRGGDDGYGGTASEDDTSDKAYIEAKDFSLSSITVAPGASVKVENQGSATHTVTADDGAFDSGKVAGGSSGSFTAPTAPGQYPFHCTLHASMTGTLTVAG